MFADELLEDIQEEFDERYEEDSAISRLLEKKASGSATLIDADEYARRVGTIMGNSTYAYMAGAFGDEKVLFGTASRILRSVLHTDYEKVADYATAAQKTLLEASGLGLNPVAPAFNEERAHGLAEYVSKAERIMDTAGQFVEAVVNNAQSVVTDSIRENVDWQYRAGLSPTITRIAGAGSCSWCADQAGVFDYADVKKGGADVFRRHLSCTCTVVYDPGNGRKQDVHSKRWYEDEKDAIGQRKTYGLDENLPTPQERIKKAQQMAVNKARENGDMLLLEAENPFKHPRTPLTIDSYDQSKHIVGGEKYNAYISTHEQPPSYLTISEKEAQELVDKFHGTGILRLNKNGDIISQEMIVDNDKVIGYAVNNINGEKVAATGFKIHYSDRGTHIVPMYENQKEYWKRMREENGHDWLFRQKSGLGL